MLQDTAVRAAGILAAARDEAPKHRRLLRTPRDGRILSALMLPFFMLRPPTGFGVLTTTWMCCRCGSSGFAVRWRRFAVR